MKKGRQRDKQIESQKEREKQERKTGEIKDEKTSKRTYEKLFYFIISASIY